MSFPYGRHESKFSHYSPFTMSPELLVEYGSWASEKIISITETKENSIPFVFYSGMSGVALATATMIAISQQKQELVSAYIRKENERSNFKTKLELYGSTKEELDNYEFYFFFLDDFIWNGVTLEHCKRSIKSNLDLLVNTENLSIITAEEHGSAEYYSHDSHFFLEENVI